MRVSGVKYNFYNYLGNYQRNNSQSPYFTREHGVDTFSFEGKKTVSENPDAWPVNNLMKKGLPCMYCGRKMIPQGEFTKLCNSQAVSGAAVDALKALKPYKNSLHSTERVVFNIIEKQAAIYPDKSISEIVQYIAPKYKQKLREEQWSLFMKLDKLAKKMPDGHRYRYSLFMAETNDRLNDLPIFAHFSPKDFSYKIKRIMQDTKRPEMRDKLAIIAWNMPYSNGPDTQKLQLATLDAMTSYIKKSKTKEAIRLLDLFENTKGRINKEKVEAPFSRKSFIYDLDKRLKEIGDENLRGEMLAVASQLPNSRMSHEAFIVKHEGNPSDLIVSELFRPSTGTIEHIKPRSANGESKPHNYGHACSSCNSDRSCKPLSVFIKKNPKVKKYIKGYLDQLIRYSNDKTFAEMGISYKHVQNVAQVLDTESKGRFKPDILRLKIETPKVKKKKKV